ncbi:zf-HC2 domain-containing protein [Mycobacterium sp. MFM001]|uniref:anti-sigma factor family protein n=1 Tax=Mycobacterium sp. MFM001 TaxID=2049453 RepID=UPI000E2ED3A1
MITRWGAGPTDDGGRTPGDDHEYAMWDAAYVLGSLSDADRHEFEAHLRDCASCRGAVAELSGMPALLSRLDDNVVAEIEAADDTGDAAVPPEMLPSLLAKVAWRRRRSRVITWTASGAAAAVLAIGVFVGVKPHSPASVPAPQASAPAVPAAPQPSASSLEMAQVGTKALASTVSVSGQHWGTYIDMKCVCLAPVYAHHDRLAMVVVGRDGSRTQLATWVAEPGHTANPAGSISTPVDQIAAVQVVSADNGNVLLERSL